VIVRGFELAAYIALSDAIIDNQILREVGKGNF
jgi:hypothetical protein